MQRLMFVLLLLATTQGCQSLVGSKATAVAAQEGSGKDDPWVRSAGDIARTEHTYEEVHDPLGLRKYFTSEKARSIERNVGIGD